MKRGGQAALLASCLALGGCSASTEAVKLRPIADPSAVLRKGGDTVAVARAQLMLGNVGLAIEGFRKAQRDDPANPAALAGLGDSYASMGRFDLAQSNYEAALALAPHDRTILLGLATAFERQGKIASAMAARADAAVAVPPSVIPAAPVAAAPAKAPGATKPVVAMAASPKAAEPAPAVGSITVKLPPPRPAEPVRLKSEALGVGAVDYSAASSATVPVPPAPEPVRLSSRALGVGAVDYSAASSARVPVPPAPEPVRLSSEALPAGHTDYSALPLLTVPVAPPPPERVALRAAPLRPVSAEPDYSSVALASALAIPPRPEPVRVQAAPIAAARAEIDYSALSSSVTVPLPPARPATPAPKTQEVALRPGSSPRLERLTLGEVALVTTGKPIWTPAKSADGPSISGVRWVALAPAGRPNIQILNAARSQGLAASARTVLVGRGWRKIDVGNAPAAQGRSEVLYSKNRATLGRRLAAQFGVAARMVERDVLVLVLGRDAVDRITGQRRS